MSVVPREPVIAEVAKEKELIMVNPWVIKDAMEVLLITTETLSSEAVGGTAVIAMASLPTVQAMVKVLSTMVELLAVR